MEAGRLALITVITGITVALLALVPLAGASTCRATCSPHVTLPCSFGSLDPCLTATCQKICAEDGGRRVAGCFCRGSVEGPTFRACFCAQSKRNFVQF